MDLPGILKLTMPRRPGPVENSLVSAVVTAMANFQGQKWWCWGVIRVMATWDWGDAHMLQCLASEADVPSLWEEFMCFWRCLFSLILIISWAPFSSLSVNSRAPKDAVSKFIFTEVSQRQFMQHLNKSLTDSFCSLGLWICWFLLLFTPYPVAIFYV